MSRYDWTDKRIPDWVQEIATDGDGEVCGYRKAYKSEISNWWVDYEGLGWITLWYGVPCPDWADSKEQRPLPAAPVVIAAPSPVLAAALARIASPYTSKIDHLSPQQARALYLYIEELRAACGADLAGEGGK
jgi:hypothetical protein